MYICIYMYIYEYHKYHFAFPLKFLKGSGIYLLLINSPEPHL